MIFQNSVTNAIFTILSSDSIINDINAKVFINDLFNQDPNNTPWIGIYNSAVTVETERVQKPNPWKITYSPRIYTQAIDYRFDGETTHNALDDLTNRVIMSLEDAFKVNRTLNGTVDKINGYDITPHEVEIDEDTSIFSYEITINAERRQIT